MNLRVANQGRKLRKIAFGESGYKGNEKAQKI